MKEDLKLKKRMELGHMLSKIFGNDADLVLRLLEVQEQQKNSDPFIEKEPEINYTKPLKSLSNVDPERFKALKTKTLTKEEPKPEVSDAETGGK